MEGKDGVDYPYITLLTKILTKPYSWAQEVEVTASFSP
jgi:hypothetical protein